MSEIRFAFSRSVWKGLKGGLHQQGLNEATFRANQGFVDLGFILNRVVLHHFILNPNQGLEF